jgi:outer membrane translocation and assembly module TamA
MRRAATRAIMAAIAAAQVAGAAARAESANAAVAADGDDEAPREPTHVEAIEWHGVSALDSGVLEDAILTAEPTWVDRVLFWRSKPVFREEALERDMRRIADAYAEESYFEASARYELAWNDARDRVRIDIFVIEGESVRLEDWELEVPDQAPLSADHWTELRALLPRPGVLFGSRLYRETRDAVLLRLADLGHPAAALEGGAEVDLATHVARVVWKAELGPRVRLGAIEVTGLDRVQEKIVRRELQFREGDVYSGKTLGESERRVYDLGLFRSVAIQANRPDRGSEPEPDARAEAAEPQREQPEPRSEEVWPVEVRVAERDLRSFRISVGYGTEDLFRTRASWLHRNFLGEARHFEVRGEYSALIAGASAELRQAHLLDSDVRGWIRGTAFQEDEPAYDANRVISGIGVERLFARHWIVSAEPIVEWGRVEDSKVDDPTDPDGPREVFLDSLRLALRRSTVDDEVDPRRGSRLEFTLEPSTRALGSDLNYLEATVEGRAYVPIHVTVLAIRLKASTFEPLGSDGRGDVPLFKRLYAGGSVSVRGFDYHRLGPRDKDGDPLGGLSLAEGSLELRFPIWPAVGGLLSGLGGVVFLDAGEVSKRPHDWRGDDFFYAGGGGLRLGTPVGPIRLDVGHVLNPSDFEKDFRVHFSVGHTF